MCTKLSFNLQRGVSLIELIIFIVMISTALIGIISVMNLTSAHSADPLIRKQALAIAESLLEEVELMPFTFCDPDDANAASAVTATGGCALAANEEGTVIGPEAGETRYSTATPFDNVSDYHNFSMSGPNGIRDITNTVVSTLLDGYSASVRVAATDFGGITATSGDALQITVTVDGPGGTQIVLDGYRTRFSPRI